MAPTPRTPSREELAERLGALVPALRRRFTAALPSDLREEISSLTPHQLEALCHLSGGGRTMHELADIQGCAMSSATALADRLLRHGLAERVHDEADRRVVHLVPTSRGLALLRRFGEAKRRSTLAAVAPLDDGQLRTLVGLLSTIADGGIPMEGGDGARAGGAGTGTALARAGHG